MKKSLLTSILFLFLFTNMNSSFAQSFSNVGDYMKYISDQHDKIHKDMWDYVASVAHGKSARKVENKRKDLISTTGDALKKIKKLPDWQGDGAYRDTVASYLQVSLYVAKDDYGKIVDMEEVAEQSYDAMEAYLLAQQKADDKLDDAFQLLIFEQRRFAGDHNVTLIDSKDKLDVKLERAGDVFKYYNKLYLVFFKPYKQEVYLLDAIKKGDVSAMEQNKNSLATFSEESLKKLDTIKSYKGDISLTTACKKVLNFLLKEANEKVQGQIDFFLKKDNFDKQKAAMDAIPQEKRTQADVDNFNKAVNEYNAAIAEFNKTVGELNTQRSNVIDGWNNAMQNFLNRQVPAKH
jgi:hypothetical protein